MPARTRLSRSALPFAVLGVLVFAAVNGCTKDHKPFKFPRLRKDKALSEIPLHVRGTVAQYALLFGGGQMRVQGHGIVVGLGTNGSAEVPAHLRKSLTEYLLKQNMGSARWGTSAMTPGVILRDKDTSVVLIGGAIPQGAPLGTRFDVFVTSLPQTQTRSLEGGWLMPIDMRLAFGNASRLDKVSKIWAKAIGAVFVNPFIDPSDKHQSAKLRMGRIIGGGKVARSRPIRLQLIRADYSRADSIQRRINERFPSDRKVANALNRSIIELRIPPEYRDDYEHFLKLIMHLPVRTKSSEWEVQVRQIAKEMEAPSADHDSLALVWEAMGRGVIELIQDLYTSENPAAAFHAARTGMRLGDRLALEVILRFATTSNCPQQIPAIEELGDHEMYTRVVRTLRQLLDVPNERVRIAAYDALIDQRDRRSVQRVDVSGDFTLDLVSSGRSYTIYATQTAEPRIALFGKGMKVSCPIYFEPPDELVTINAFPDSDKLTVFRKIPRTGAPSEPLEVDKSVRSLIEILGSRPEMDDDGNIMGLGLTYSQVVSVIYRMCEEGDIPAKFVLQEVPALQRIYQRTTTVGRPDMVEP